MLKRLDISFKVTLFKGTVLILTYFLTQLW